MMENGRFERQIHWIGAQNMRRIRESHIAIYGLGGSGSPIALQLAYLGAGHLTLVDPDVVDVSNLNRQVLYGQPDVGRPKVEAAAERLRRIDPEIGLTLALRHDEKTLCEAMDQYNVVVDAADEYRFKVLLDRSCRQHALPMIHTSAVALRGSVVTFTGNSPGYEKYFDLPSYGRPIDAVGDEEFEARFRHVVDRLVSATYPESLTEAVADRRLGFQTLVPAPMIAGGVAVSEIIRILVGQSPLYGPESPFHFDLSKHMEI